MIIPAKYLDTKISITDDISNVVIPVTMISLSISFYLDLRLSKCLITVLVLCSAAMTCVAFMVSEKKVDT